MSPFINSFAKQKKDESDLREDVTPEAAVLEQRLAAMSEVYFNQDGTQTTRAKSRAAAQQDVLEERTEPAAAPAATAAREPDSAASTKAAYPKLRDALWEWYVAAWRFQDVARTFHSDEWNRVCAAFSATPDLSRQIGHSVGSVIGAHALLPRDVAQLFIDDASQRKLAAPNVEIFNAVYERLDAYLASPQLDLVVTVPLYGMQCAGPFALEGGVSIDRLDGEDLTTHSGADYALRCHISTPKVIDGRAVGSGPDLQTALLHVDDYGVRLHRALKLLRHNDVLSVGYTAYTMGLADSAMRAKSALPVNRPSAVETSIEDADQAILQRLWANLAPTSYFNSEGLELLEAIEQLNGARDGIISAAKTVFAFGLDRQRVASHQMATQAAAYASDSGAVQELGIHSGDVFGIVKDACEARELTASHLASLASVTRHGLNWLIAEKPVKADMEAAWDRMVRKALRGS